MILVTACTSTAWKMNFKEMINILWFRNGLRLHDNESLKIAAGDKGCKLLPIFIFDGETPTTNYCKYNKISFLLECLDDLDTQLFYCGGKVNLVEGNPVDVIRVLSKQFNIHRLCFDQNSEPIWLDRDNAVKNYCGTHRIELCESIKALKVQLANFELYSSSPKEVRVSLGNVWPGRAQDWVEFGTFLYKDERAVQTFKSEQVG